jgi:hypothetical protein
MSVSIAVKSTTRCSAADARARVSANSRRNSSVSIRNCPISPRVPFTRIALKMLDLNLPVAAIESVAGTEVMVSMHSIRCSINESQVAPAMVTEVFTSAIARAVRRGEMKAVQ